MLLKNLFRTELLEDEFLRAVDLFNSNEQEQSYNLLFDLWHDSKSPNRKVFYQGLLQASAALQLLQKQKYYGARKVYSCAIRKLLPYASLTKPFNVKEFVHQMINYFENYDFEFGVEDLDIRLLPRPKLQHVIPR